jgi:hypothetical protein
MVCDHYEGFQDHAQGLETGFEVIFLEVRDPFGCENKFD